MNDLYYAINIYTDGSFKIGGGRKGGAGISIHYPDGTKEFIKGSRYLETSIPRMELRACIDAVKEIQKNQKIIESSINHYCIHTDSKYIVDNRGQAMFGNMFKKDAKTSNGNDWANIDLWKDLVREMKKVNGRIDILKIKGHSGIVGNEEADKLAKQSRELANKKDISKPSGRVRSWLSIEEKDFDEVETKQNFVLYIKRTMPRSAIYEADVQIIGPKKYFGFRTRIRGKIKSQTLHCGHIYELKLFKDMYNFLVVKDIIRDIGRPSDNKIIWKPK